MGHVHSEKPKLSAVIGETMRALLITQEGVKEVEHDGSLKSLYDLIGCSMVEGAGYPDRNHACWVDEEGLFDLYDGKQLSIVSWYPQRLVGKLLITGFNPDDGETIAATMPMDDLHSMIKVGTLLKR